jgi:hypothetical protein
VLPEELVQVAVVVEGVEVRDDLEELFGRASRVRVTTPGRVSGSM